MRFRQRMSSQPSSGTWRSWLGNECSVWTDLSSFSNTFFGSFRSTHSLFLSLHTLPIMLEEAFTALCTFWAFLNHHKWLEAYLHSQVFILQNKNTHSVRICIFRLDFSCVSPHLFKNEHGKAQQPGENLLHVYKSWNSFGSLYAHYSYHLWLVDWHLLPINVERDCFGQNRYIFASFFFYLTEYCSFLSSISWRIIWFSLAFWSALYILLRNVLDFHERGAPTWPSLVHAEFERPWFQSDQKTHESKPGRSFKVKTTAINQLIVHLGDSSFQSPSLACQSFSSSPFL